MPDEITETLVKRDHKKRVEDLRIKATLQEMARSILRVPLTDTLAKKS